MQNKTSKNSLITGANAGAFSLLLKQIVSEPNAPLILIEENESKAQNLYGELNSILEDDAAHYFQSMQPLLRKLRLVHQTN